MNWTNGLTERYAFSNKVPPIDNIVAYHYIVPDVSKKETVAVALQQNFLKKYPTEDEFLRRELKRMVYLIDWIQLAEYWNEKIIVQVQLQFNFA